MNWIEAHNLSFFTQNLQYFELKIMNSLIKLYNLKQENNNGTIDIIDISGNTIHSYNLAYKTDELYIR